MRPAWWSCHSASDGLFLRLRYDMNKEILQKLKSIQDHINKIKRTEYPPSHEVTKQVIIQILEERKERRMRELLKGK